ncbi:MAG TPA: ABC transporter ATP-binding protein [Acidimicrobiales bacterium]|nr:ABC transporter ATP-binding protein [Acidimicrobiales bacterium]
MSTAIAIEGVSKQFRLYHQKYTSLKERALHPGRIPYEEFWALREVSAEIEAGKTIGILGRNGSGKSTLLKCLAGILRPTSGQVVLRGSLAAMLELGAGFQPELSGRDNVYLNGSLLGFSRREMDRRFDDIVVFAELEQFIDNQVKYYSSGMYVRLGFAVAVNVEPDILLVDEVLAVGDERFQMKCMERVHQFQAEGRTIVVVSHSPDMMRQTCDQVMVLDHGELIHMGRPGEAIRAFRDRLADTGYVPDPASPEAIAAGHVAEIRPVRPRMVRIGHVSIEHEGQPDRTYLVTGEPLTVRVRLDVVERVLGAGFRVSVMRGGEAIFVSDTGQQAGGITLEPGQQEVTFRFASIPLLDGSFALHLDVRDGGGLVLDLREPACTFEVMNPHRSTGLVYLPLDVALDGALDGRPSLVQSGPSYPSAAYPPAPAGDVEMPLSGTAGSAWS